MAHNFLRHLFFFLALSSSLKCMAYLPVRQVPVSIPGLSAFMDLEQCPSECVLESKQIFINEYPTAFNPTLVRWHGELLMAFRAYRSATGYKDFIGMVWLDENFEVKTPVIELEVNQSSSGTPSKKQDPRLIVIKDELYVVYSNSFPGLSCPEVRRMFIAKVHYDGVRFFTDLAKGLFYFQGEQERRWEKNWVPFEYDEQLFLAYSILPHRILQPKINTESCNEVAISKGNINWEWGDLRGGTQAYLYGKEYLSFFHSSIQLRTTQSEGRNIPHYFIGAYTFSSTPPFEITRISSQPIIGKGFYTGPAYRTWRPLRVVFPGGYVFDDQYIWIVYGKQDHELWVVKLDVKKLFEALVEIQLVP